MDNTTESHGVLLCVSTAFERLVQRNDCSSSGYKRPTPFHGSRSPSISILKYLQRIDKYTNCSPSCFIVGFMYVDKLTHKHPEHSVVSLNVHRLLITSILIATKLVEDLHYNNEFYSRVGGISLAELNQLELDFLFRLNFQLHVTSNTFQAYCKYLERELLLAGKHVERTIPINTLEEGYPVKKNDRNCLSLTDEVQAAM